MKNKSIQWLITSISVFVLGCTIYYYVQYFKGKDARYNYAVEQNAKKHKKLRNNSLLLAQESAVVNYQKVLKNTTESKDDQQKSEKCISKKEKKGEIKEKETQVEFKPEWLVISQTDNVDIPEDVEETENSYIVNNYNTTKSQEETSKIISMVENYQNESGMIVQNTNNSGNSQITLSSGSNTGVALADNSQLIAMADNSSNDNALKGPMKATGSGTEDPFTSGAGTGGNVSDNTTTYNDNNVMGSLPIGDGTMFLFFLIALSAGVKFIRYNKTLINQNV